MINYMSNGKATIILLIAGLIKKKSLYKMSYFPELYTHCKNKKKFELDLSNYIKKSDLTTQQVLIHQILPNSLI